MEFEKELTQSHIIQSQGTVHKRVDEEEPPAPKPAELPKEESQEEGMVDLLGNPIDPPKKENKSASKPKAKAAPKKEVKPKEEVKYGPEFRIAYARHSENLPHEDMTLEEIRQYLEVDFPELSKERTKMDVDDKTKTIVPMVLGAKKG